MSSLWRQKLTFSDVGLFSDTQNRTISCVMACYGENKWRQKASDLQLGMRPPHAHSHSPTSLVVPSYLPFYLDFHNQSLQTHL